MTFQIFMQNLEKYFGKYENQVIKKAVEKFVSDNWQESELETLLNDIIKSYSTKFKTQPDVSFFNEMWEKDNSIENKAEIAWYLLFKLKISRSILCTDIILQETIKSMGGVDIFLDYRDRNNHWCRKDFINRYVRLYSLDFIKDQKIEILKNELERMYPKYPPESFYNDIIVIGNQDKGRLLLEEKMKEQPQLENKKEDIIHISKVLKSII